MAIKLTTNQLSCLLSQLQILKNVNFINILEIPLTTTTLPTGNFPLKTEQAAPEYQGGLFYIRLEQVSV